jgi:hypothetical protein
MTTGGPQLYRLGRHHGDPADTLTLSRTPRETEPRLFIDSFADSIQKRITARVPPEVSAPASRRPVPEHYRDSYDHFTNFFADVRSRQPVVEDAVFGYRAAGAALLSNLSIERGAAVEWDPDAMKLAA